MLDPLFLPFVPWLTWDAWALGWEVAARLAMAQRVSKRQGMSEVAAKDTWCLIV